MNVNIRILVTKTKITNQSIEFADLFLWLTDKLAALSDRYRCIIRTFLEFQSKTHIPIDEIFLGRGVKKEGWKILRGG